MSLIDLLSVGPGTSVYHFLVLLALGAMGGIAFIEWRHTSNPDHRRILWAFGGLAALRLPLLLVEPRLAMPGAPAVVAPRRYRDRQSRAFGMGFFGPRPQPA